MEKYMYKYLPIGIIFVALIIGISANQNIEMAFVFACAKYTLYPAKIAVTTTAIDFNIFDFMIFLF